MGGLWVDGSASPSPNLRQQLHATCSPLWRVLAGAAVAVNGARDGCRRGSSRDGVGKTVPVPHLALQMAEGWRRGLSSRWRWTGAVLPAASPPPVA